MNSAKQTVKKLCSLAVDPHKGRELQPYVFVAVAFLAFLLLGATQFAGVTIDATPEELANLQKNAAGTEAICKALVEHKRPIILTDGDGYITFANQVAWPIFGAECCSDVVGHNITEFMPLECGKKFLRVASDPEFEGKSQRIECIILAGEKRTKVTVSVEPLTISDAKVCRGIVEVEE